MDVSKNSGTQNGWFIIENPIWLVLSDEQMSKRWPFSLLNDEQMSNWVGVKHLPAIKIDDLGVPLFLETPRFVIAYDKDPGT